MFCFLARLLTDTEIRPETGRKHEARYEEAAFPGPDLGPDQLQVKAQSRGLSLLRYSCEADVARFRGTSELKHTHTRRGGF